MDRRGFVGAGALGLFGLLNPSGRSPRCNNVPLRGPHLRALCVIGAAGPPDVIAPVAPVAPAAPDRVTETPG